MTINQPFSHLASIETTDQLPPDFNRLGSLGDVYPAYNGQNYILDIWENANQDRIILAALGGNECAYLGNGSIQGVAAYLYGGYSRDPQPTRLAVIGDTVIYMSKNQQIAQNSPLGIGASYRVHGTSPTGVFVSINNQTHLITHGEYVVL